MSKYLTLPIHRCVSRLSARKYWRSVELGRIRYALTDQGEVKGVLLPIGDIGRLNIEATAQPSMPITQFKKNVRGNLPAAGYLPLTYHTRPVLVILHPDHIKNLDLPLIGNRDNPPNLSNL